jgi:hypothetical protein
MAHDERPSERVRRVLSTRRDLAERKRFGGLAFTVDLSMGVAR